MAHRKKLTSFNPPRSDHPRAPQPPPPPPVTRNRFNDESYSNLSPQEHQQIIRYPQKTGILVESYVKAISEIVQEFELQQKQQLIERQFLRGVILEEIQNLILRLLEFVDVMIAMRVCKHWFMMIVNDDLWKIRCEILLAPPKPVFVSYLQWFLEMYCLGSYDPTILTNEIIYLRKGMINRVAIKLHHYPDVSIALVGRLMEVGKIYMEFVTRSRGTEIYVGATPFPDKVIKAKGMDIVQHEDTWAYTDGRRFGIQIQGVTFDAENFGLHDVIGIYLNIDDREVSFYKNGVLQNRVFKLSTERWWQIFIMLDAAQDYVEIVRCAFCDEHEKTLQQQVNIQADGRGLK